MSLPSTVRKVAADLLAFPENEAMQIAELVADRARQWREGTPVIWPAVFKVAQDPRVVAEGYEAE